MSAPRPVRIWGRTWGRRAALGLLLACAVGGAAAADAKHEVFTALRDNLAGMDKLCAGFEQQRILKALGRPLISAGEMHFDRTSGILWRVLTPFPDTLLITETDVFSVAADGTRTPTPMGRNVVFEALTKTFLGLLTGDMRALDEAFEIEAERTGTHWRLRMVPKAANLAKAVARITANGERFVESMAIVEARGDETHIAFSGMAAGACPPARAQ